MFMVNKMMLFFDVGAGFFETTLYKGVVAFQLMPPL